MLFTLLLSVVVVLLAEECHGLPHLRVLHSEGALPQPVLLVAQELDERHQQPPRVRAVDYESLEHDADDGLLVVIGRHPPEHGEYDTSEGRRVGVGVPELVDCRRVDDVSSLVVGLIVQGAQEPHHTLLHRLPVTVTRH